MKIAPLTKKDSWYHRILSDPQTETQALGGVPAEIVVHMESVEILHHGPDRNYRPYLHLHGQLNEVVPDVELPYGITSLPFKAGTAPTVDAFYEFDNDQLADLVSKDYFSPRFRVPDAMIGIPWDLPGRFDALVVAPAFTDQPPLVFVGLRDQNSQELTEANSDYDLSEYFPDYTPGQREQQAQTSEREMRVRSDEIKDIFADVELDDQRYTEPPRHAQIDGGDLTVPEGIFDRLMREVQSSQQQRLVESVETKQYDPRSAEGLYHGRVAPGVDEALSREVQDEVEADREVDEAEYEKALQEQERQAEQSEDYLDLLDEESEQEDVEIGVAPVSLGEGEQEQAHRQAAERQQARRRAELANEEADTPQDERQPGL